MEIDNRHSFVTGQTTGCNGGDSCCTSTNQCNIGEGDCDKDSHCLPGLKCGKDNCIGDGFDKTDDCCFDEGK